MAAIDVLMIHEDVEEGRAVLRGLDWTALDMSPVACVPTVDLALEIMQKRNVDILLADIGALMQEEKLIDSTAGRQHNFLVIIIADPRMMDRVLLAMRYQSVYDYVETPLRAEEITKTLAEARNVWLDWSFSRAVRDLTAIQNKGMPEGQKKSIDNMIRSIVDATEEADLETIADKVKMLFHDFLSLADSRNMALARAEVMELLTQLKYLLAGKGIENDDEFALYAFIHKVCKATNGADLEDLCLNYIHRCVSLMSADANSQMSALVRTALQITKERYCDSSFTLVSLADEIGISPNYLSSVFKMETGIRFKKYLNAYRIDKAKELLMDSRYKIYEVSDLVGIEDSRYFSQIFKTYTGMKPSDFRDNKKS